MYLLSRLNTLIPVAACIMLSKFHPYEICTHSSKVLDKDFNKMNVVNNEEFYLY